MKGEKFKGTSAKTAIFADGYHVVAANVNKNNYLLDKLSDEELVVIARSDRGAEALVISRYIKFIWKKSESFANSLINFKS